MMNLSIKIDSYDINELTNGYSETDAAFTCVVCGLQAEKGVVYPAHDVLYEASRYVRDHVDTEHGGMFDVLLSLDKSLTGVSDVQRGLLQRWQRQDSDEAIRADLGVGSLSTIRNHRYLLKEKERQARVFIAIMNLLKRTTPRPPAPAVEPTLARLPRRDRDRQALLQSLSERFDTTRKYSEGEVNDILRPVWPDYAFLRRNLVSYGLLQRTDDGSQYWRPVESENKTVDRKTELKRIARQTPVQAGLFQIRNERNGKIFIDTTRNLKTMNGQVFQLEQGMHRNKALQADWGTFGKSAFTVEVLEMPDMKPHDDVVDILKKLKAAWMTKLQPYGDGGYHERGR